MQLKPGVRLLGIRPEVVLGLIAAQEVWRKQSTELVVTACIDGVHKRASEHYSGCAVDLRVHGLPDAAAAQAELKAALGEDFDVILENAGTPTQHIHLEFQPKLAY